MAGPARTSCPLGLITYMEGSHRAHLNLIHLLRRRYRLDGVDGPLWYRDVGEPLPSVGVVALVGAVQTVFHDKIMHKLRCDGFHCCEAWMDLHPDRDSDAILTQPRPLQSCSSDPFIRYFLLSDTFFYSRCGREPQAKVCLTVCSNYEHIFRFRHGCNGAGPTQSERRY